MSKRKTNSRRRDVRSIRSALKSPAKRRSGETQPVDAATVAWTVSVTMVLMCDIVAIGAHFYTEHHPLARNMNLLKELMLFAGAVIGFVSLALLPIVVKVRRAPPPRGVMAFAVCAAAAPILALIVHNMR
jgi:hypothetical protein